MAEKDESTTSVPEVVETAEPFKVEAVKVDTDTVLLQPTSY
ncbi:hypothetical protein [Lentzea cavernae]|uniref:Uncharacterized protein n=1 Tax=Lentzea cavernae TaxID=2020703 RepID=A0ABQ3M4M1_9PSEU|nr:hypothetical protein [Lentzea cavernae]GHH32427.1 hypothetical protein GCM10017774_13320 [Lentzea cavernae]